MDNLIKHEYFKLWKSMLDIDLQTVFGAIEQIKLAPHILIFTPLFR